MRNRKIILVTSIILESTQSIKSFRNISETKQC